MFTDAVLVRASELPARAAMKIARSDPLSGLRATLP
jgi:hypothetical protein